MAGLVVAGAGVVAAGIGTYFGVQTLSDESRVNQLCPASRCVSTEGLTASGAAHSDARAADLGVGLGIAAVAVGVVLAFFFPPSDAPPGDKPVVPASAASVVPTDVGLGVRW